MKQYLSTDSSKTFSEKTEAIQVLINTALYMLETFSEIRLLQLQKLTKGCKADIVFVTAFLNRAKFKQFMVDIAWETEVWIADNPDHLVHFNGDKFLGPYKKD
ncbi:MAG: BsuBI/PstI family type II restriction endonuclease [Chitinophagaceae bacterium]